MKKLLAVAVALVVASSAIGQVLQVAETAGSVDQGKLSGTAGFMLGMSDNKAKVLAIRCSYGVIQDLLLIGDLGYEFEAKVAAIGIAGQYSLTSLLGELPVDLAVRLGLGVRDFEIKDQGVLQFMVTVSKEIEQVQGLALYGGLGLTKPLASGSKVEFMGTIGAKYAIAAVENLSAYGEISYYMKNPAIGAGVVYDFIAGGAAQ